MYNMVDLSGRKIIVTGASSGIGRTTAVNLSRLGAITALVGRREEKLKETLEMLEGENHQFYVDDLSELSTISNLMSKIKMDYGAMDGLVYCAGITDPRPINVLSPEALDKTMRINFYAFIEFVRVMTKKGNFNTGASIVGISSSASTAGGKGQCAYSASKAAMDAASRILALELSDKGIRVNTVRPGMTNTEMYAIFKEKRGNEGYDELLKRQFFGIGEPDDIANLIAFLLSPAAKFITGSNMAIDGGYTCH